MIVINFFASLLSNKQINGFKFLKLIRGINKFELLNNSKFIYSLISLVQFKYLTKPFAGIMSLL